jgi:hypothetical protein
VKRRLLRLAEQQIQQCGRRDVQAAPSSQRKPSAAVILLDGGVKAESTSQHAGEQP